MWRTFGQHVKGRRRDLGKTQSGCAKIAGITRQRWIAIEKGASTKTVTVLAIAAALELPESEVLEWRRLPESNPIMIAGGALMLQRLVGFFTELSQDSQLDAIAIMETLWKLHREI
jgi:DNA-binding XRE family transcriptional regulator